MRIAVIGLGIMGASVARAIKANTEYEVDGWNRNREVVSYALEHNYIDGEVKDVAEYDIVIVALPPEVTMSYLDETTFKDNAIVADICGIKKPIEDLVYSKARNYRYVGTHPMAGKETRGILSSSESLFRGANVILINAKKTDSDAINTVSGLYQAMGCGKLVFCTADYHDRKVAYTSQLAHIVSNAYVKSRTISNCGSFTGGSYQDMTRIADLDPEVWSQLFCLNKKNLLPELQNLINNLNAYLVALMDDDEKGLKELLDNGGRAFRNVTRKNEKPEEKPEKEEKEEPVADEGNGEE